MLSHKLYEGAIYESTSKHIFYKRIILSNTAEKNFSTYNLQFKFTLYSSGPLATLSSGKLPWQALIEIDVNGEPWTCGGSLISANKVLTAGQG